MNYCTKCQSHYTQPGTCNCFAPVVTSIHTSGYCRVACPGCQKIECDHSGTACPLPVTTTTTVSWKQGDPWLYINGNTVDWKNAAGNQPLQWSFT